MKQIKDAFSAIVNILSKQFYFFASLASIIGFIFLFIKNEQAVWIALVFFCVVISAFCIALILTLLKLVSLKNNDFDSKSTFVKYETTDGNIINFEVYKLIQSKKTILTEHNYNFKWSGSILPKIQSDLQEVINVVDEQDPSKYDHAILRFKKPVYFNDNEVIHFKAILDDTNKASDTHISNRIFQEVDIIHYRVILKYKNGDYNVNAFLERKKLNSINDNYEVIREIPFDGSTKSYEYHLLKPQIGYIYRIRWVR